jgi:hypothetical protein
VDLDAIDRSLAELRAILAADGADLVLAGTDGASAEVTLRLVLEGSECADCVVPAPLIADIAQSVFDTAGAGVEKVIVDDPRLAG